MKMEACRPCQGTRNKEGYWSHFARYVSNSARPFWRASGSVELSAECKSLFVINASERKALMLDRGKLKGYCLLVSYLAVTTVVACCEEVGLIF